MHQPVIQTKALTKHYGTFQAVEDLTLSVPKGSICGFLGQNGAGKSTTIKMLLGMVRPSNGEGSILGLDIREEKQSVEIRKKVAYVAEDKRLYDYMTVGNMIQFTRSFFPNWDQKLQRHLLNEFRLPLDRKVKKLSKGMRTQLALLLGFCRNSEILILDEPSEGLDPVNNEKVLKLLVNMAADGKTIFFSSHHVFEVEMIADHIIMLHKGRLIDEKSLDQMKADYKLFKIFFPEKPAWDPSTITGVRSVVREANSVLLFADNNEERIMQEVSKINPSSVEIIPLSLKDIFLENLKSIDVHAV